VLSCAELSGFSDLSSNSNKSAREKLVTSSVCWHPITSISPLVRWNFPTSNRDTCRGCLKKLADIAEDAGDEPSLLWILGKESRRASDRNGRGMTHGVISTKKTPASKSLAGAFMVNVDQLIDITCC